MERTVEEFLVHGGRQSEYTLRYLTKLLSGPDQYPAHVVEILNNLRLHAEEDYSNYLHLQSVLPHHTPSKGGAEEGRAPRAGAAVRRGETRPSLGDKVIHEEMPDQIQEQTELDGDVETAVAAGDDVFLLEGVEDSRSPQSLTFSDGEGEEDEADEGIHIPRKHSKRQSEVAASLPVSIPWPEQLTTSRRTPVTIDDEKNGGHPTDIAASMQAIARSMHTSSMFGDNVFGELPRPRRNTLSKQ